MLLAALLSACELELALDEDDEEDDDELELDEDEELELELDEEEELELDEELELELDELDDEDELEELVAVEALVSLRAHLESLTTSSLVPLTVTDSTVSGIVQLEAWFLPSR